MNTLSAAQIASLVVYVEKVMSEYPAGGTEWETALQELVDNDKSLPKYKELPAAILDMLIFWIDMYLHPEEFEEENDAPTDRNFLSEFAKNFVDSVAKSKAALKKRLVKKKKVAVKKK